LFLNEHLTLELLEGNLEFALASALRVIFAFWPDQFADPIHRQRVLVQVLWLLSRLDGSSDHAGVAIN
jgi:hypothetical protein